MKQELKSLALGLFLSGAVFSFANAATVIHDEGGSVGGLGNSLTNLGGGISTFEEGTITSFPANAVGASTPFGSGGLSWSGLATVTSGTQSGVTATPWLDATKYLSIIAQPNLGPAILTLAVQATQLGLYWGSIDTYNSIQFYLNNVLVDTFSGTTLAPASGCQNADPCNRYIVLNTLPFDKVVFSTNGTNSFEIDNVSVNAVPVPGAAVLFLTGLAGLGYLGRRRARSRTAAA